MQANQRDSRYDGLHQNDEQFIVLSQRDEDNVGGSPHHLGTQRLSLNPGLGPCVIPCAVTRNFYANGKEKSQLQSEISGHERENPVLGGESWRVPDSGTTFCGQGFHGNLHAFEKPEDAKGRGLWVVEPSQEYLSMTAMVFPAA